MLMYTLTNNQKIKLQRSIQERADSEIASDPWTTLRKQSQGSLCELWILLRH